MRHAIESNGVCVVRTRNGVGVGFTPEFARSHALVGAGENGPDIPVQIEVRHKGKLLKKLLMDPKYDSWRDYFGSAIDHLGLNIVVKRKDQILAELTAPSDPLHSFMVREGEQHHITDNGVSSPPALHITDELGAVWTLGMVAAEKEQSPDGEFAFAVLRDGVDTHEIASRIERRSGGIRVFTRHGWKRWLGREFS